MAVKRFHIANPEQLQTLVQFAKADASTIARMARIWRAAKDKHEHTHWDHGIYIYFSGDRKREAAIARLAAGDELVIVGKMKYNLALNWCEQHLRQVYD